MSGSRIFRLVELGCGSQCHECGMRFDHGLLQITEQIGPVTRVIKAGDSRDGNGGL